MATAKQRINVSLSTDMRKALSVLAKRDQVPQATKAAQLIREAIELEEDWVLSSIFDARFSQKNVTYLSHKQIWGRVLK